MTSGRLALAPRALPLRSSSPGPVQWPSSFSAGTSAPTGPELTCARRPSRTIRQPAARAGTGQHAACAPTPPRISDGRAIVPGGCGELEADGVAADLAKPHRPDSHAQAAGPPRRSLRIHETLSCSTWREVTSGGQIVGQNAASECSPGPNASQLVI